MGVWRGLHALGSKGESGSGWPRINHHASSFLRSLACHSVESSYGRNGEWTETIIRYLICSAYTPQTKYPHTVAATNRRAFLPSRRTTSVKKPFQFFSRPDTIELTIAVILFPFPSSILRPILAMPYYRCSYFYPDHDTVAVVIACCMYIPGEY